MALELTRPLVFFDLETTGIDPAVDRIVEMCFLKLHPDGSREEKVRRINPTVPIPSLATAVHGITNEDVAHEPTFAQVAKSLRDWILNCDLAGYNSNRFDVPVLVEEFLRAGVDIDLSGVKLVDVQTIFHKKEQRTLSAAYKFYCDRDIENAHSAKADVEATCDVLLAQVQRYDDLRGDVAFLSEFTKLNNNVDLAGRVVLDEKGETVFNFGKHKGRRVVDVFRAEPSFYSWMMSKDFSLDTKRVIERIKATMDTNNTDLFKA